MSRQYYEDMPVEPLDIANSAVSFLTAELALFPNLSQITIPALDVRPGKVWRLTCGGDITTPTAGTLIITPRWGTATGGTSLGASLTQNYVPSVTGAFWISALLICRAVGLSGGNSTFACRGLFNGPGAVATASSGTQITFGGAASAVCDPAAGGFFIGCTFSVTGASMTPQIVCLQSLN